MAWGFPEKLAGPIHFSLHAPFHPGAPRNSADMEQRRDLIQQCHDYAKHSLTWMGTVQKDCRGVFWQNEKFIDLKPILTFILRK